MIDHYGISATDFDRPKALYEQALAPLGASFLVLAPPEHTGGVKVGSLGADSASFWLAEGQAQNPSVHFAFSAATRDQVDAF